jgi:alanyl-tRNA synthetase
MFEMLGTGLLDYFKKEALPWLGNLTEVLKLEKDRLYVSVFEGNESENVPLIRKLLIFGNNSYLKIALFLETKKDNFWKWETKDLADLVLKFISICVLMKKERQFQVEV